VHQLYQEVEYAKQRRRPLQTAVASEAVQFSVTIGDVAERLSVSFREADGKQVIVDEMVQGKRFDRV
jgi:hypothetical protein